MSSGPIEFLGATPGQSVPDGEYGGADGLIQPVRKDGAFLGAPEAKGGHDLELGVGGGVVAEISAIMARRAMVPLSASEAVSGVADVDGVVVDPATGRIAPDAVNKKAGLVGDVVGELSALKP